MQVKEIMTRDIKFIRTNDSIRQAAAQMLEQDVGNLPVLLNTGSLFLHRPGRTVVPVEMPARTSLSSGAWVRPETAGIRSQTRVRKAHALAG